MTRKEGSDAHRHPDAVEYLEGLGEEGAAVVRPYEGGHTRYWIEGGEVRGRDVAGDGTPEALLEAVPAMSCSRPSPATSRLRTSPPSTRYRVWPPSYGRTTAAPSSPNPSGYATASGCLCASLPSFRVMAHAPTLPLGAPPAGSSGPSPARPLQNLRAENADVKKLGYTHAKPLN